VDDVTSGWITLGDRVWCPPRGPRSEAVNRPYCHGSSRKWFIEATFRQSRSELAQSFVCLWTEFRHPARTVLFERCGFSAQHTDFHQRFFQATYRSDVNCPVDATPMRFFRHGRKRLIILGQRRDVFYSLQLKDWENSFAKDIGWKETGGEADAIGLVINIVSGKPFALFFIAAGYGRNQRFRCYSGMAALRAWRQHFRVLTNDYRRIHT
jgi:hypothetical protein